MTDVGAGSDARRRAPPRPAVVIGLPNAELVHDPASLIVTGLRRQHRAPASPSAARARARDGTELVSWRCGDGPPSAPSVDIGVDRERWTRRVILAGYAGSVLTIALGAALGDRVLILGGLLVLAVLLVFARA